jgi:hypothetical protein
MMASTPLLVLAVVALYSMVYIVIDPANAMPDGTDSLDDRGDDPGDSPSGIEIVGAVLEKVWGVVVLLFGAMVFNVPDAPIYIQAPVAIIIIGSLAWSIATLIRGT